MAKGHRSQIKRERNEVKDTRPSAKLSYARVSVQKACFVLDAIRGKDVATALAIVSYIVSRAISTLLSAEYGETTSCAGFRTMTSLSFQDITKRKSKRKISRNGMSLADTISCGASSPQKVLPTCGTSRTCGSTTS